MMRGKKQCLRRMVMAAIIVASVFSITIILSFLIILGVPLGELTMGGKYKVFPKNLRLILVTQLILQVVL